MRHEEKPAQETGKGELQAKGISQPKAQRERRPQHALRTQKSSDVWSWDLGSKRRLRDRSWRRAHLGRYCTEHTVGPQLTRAPHKCFV